MSPDPLDGPKREFLASLLQVILVKLKWDEDADPEDQDDDDNAEFDKLRKVGDNHPVQFLPHAVGSSEFHGLCDYGRSRPRY